MTIDKLYSVEELAAKTGVTSRAVRLYMDKGLLTYMKAGRAYCFTPAAEHTLEDVLRAKRLGFSLDEIRARQNGRADIAEQIRRVERLRLDTDAELKALRATARLRS